MSFPEFVGLRLNGFSEVRDSTNIMLPTTKFDGDSFLFSDLYFCGDI